MPRNILNRERLRDTYAAEIVPPQSRSSPLVTPVRRENGCNARSKVYNHERNGEKRQHTNQDESQRNVANASMTIMDTSRTNADVNWFIAFAIDSRTDDTSFIT